jgi:2-hydroxy-3-keto-5-methylthiopentenyl-1-phosphate phosphatase
MPTRFLNVSPISQANKKHQAVVTPAVDIDLAASRVYIDFDNTITTFDVLDAIIEQFSIDREWVAYEEAWRAGDIGSKECLEGQLRSIRCTRESLAEYLSAVILDAHFKQLLALLQGIGIKPVILSDSFTFFIASILRNNDVRGITVYANRLRFYKDRLIPSFPHTNHLCSRCAHCKTNNFSSAGAAEKSIIYIGDGLSDVCPAQYADLVFAKSTLLGHFKKIKRHCVAFNDLGDVYNYFKEQSNESEKEGSCEAAKVSRK